MLCSGMEWNQIIQPRNVQMKEGKVKHSWQLNSTDRQCSKVQIWLSYLHVVEGKERK